MTAARRIWLGAALAAVGAMLFAVSLYLMPLWMVCLITGTGALGFSYRLLAQQQPEPAPVQQLHPEPAAPTVTPVTIPAVVPAPPPAAAPVPLMMNVASFQDGRPTGRKQIPIQVNVSSTGIRR